MELESSGDELKKVYKRYSTELGDILRLRDVRILREFLVKWAKVLGPEIDKLLHNEDPLILELIMHKIICQRPDLIDLHEESAQWLRTHQTLPGLWAVYQLPKVIHLN